MSNVDPASGIAPGLTWPVLEVRTLRWVIASQPLPMPHSLDHRGSKRYKDAFCCAPLKVLKDPRHLVVIKASRWLTPKPEQLKSWELWVCSYRSPLVLQISNMWTASVIFGVLLLKPNPRWQDSELCDTFISAREDPVLSHRTPATLHIISWCKRAVVGCRNSDSLRGTALVVCLPGWLPTGTPFVRHHRLSGRKRRKTSFNKVSYSNR